MSLTNKERIEENNIKLHDLKTKIDNLPEYQDSVIKLFETVEHMQSDSNPKEGDLAIVYRKEIQNMTNDMEISSITFPETVTLPNAYTASAYCSIRAIDESVMFDGNCQLNQSSFRFDSYSENGMIRAEYTSEDGITYTRIRLRDDNGDIDNPVELPTTAKVYNTDEWNDNLGYFMQTGGMNFGGMYEYKQYIDKDTINFYSVDSVDINIVDSTQYTNNNTITENTNNCLLQVSAEKLKEITNIIYTDLKLTNISYFLNSNKDIMFVTYKISASSDPRADLEYFTYREDNTFLGVCGFSSMLDVKLYKVDINNMTYSLSETLGALSKYEYDNTSYVPIDVFDIISFQTNVYLTGNISSNRWLSVLSNNNKRISYRGDSISIPDTKTYDVYNKYLPAENQFNLTSANQLLPGKKAYGKKGIIEGDGSIYNNLDVSILDSKFMTGLTKTDMYKIQFEDKIPNFGLKLCEKTMTYYSDDNTLLQTCENIELAETDDTRKYFVIETVLNSNNEFVIYKCTTKGIISEIKTDMNLNILSTKQYSIASDEEAYFAKLINNSLYYYSRAETSTGSGYYQIALRKLDLATGVVTNFNTIWTKYYFSTPVKTYFAYDEKSNLLYFAAANTTSLWGTINTSTDTVTIGDTSSQALSDMACLGYSDDYILLEFNSKTYIINKGSTSKTLVSSSMRFNDLYYLEYNGYRYILGVFDHSMYYTKALIGSNSFNSSWTKVYYGSSGVTSFKYNDTTLYYTRYLIATDPLIETQELDSYNCYKMIASYSSGNMRPKTIIVPMEDSLRIYGPIHIYSTFSLSISYNIKLNDINKYPNKSEFIGYCNGGYLYPLNNNYLDSALTDVITYAETVTPQEYTTAIDTTNKILGE